MVGFRENSVGHLISNLAFNNHIERPVMAGSCQIRIKPAAITTTMTAPMEVRRSGSSLTFRHELGREVRVKSDIQTRTGQKE
jgi:hypothetical protein